jgi:hypothetical protein
VVTDDRERELVDRLAGVQERINTGTVTVVLVGRDPSRDLP